MRGCSEEEVAQTNEVAADEAAAEEISFNDDAIIEEPDIVGEVPGVVASIDEKGVAVEGIVEISKSKIEELIINNTKEDVKNIAYELVPGLAKDPIAKIVPEAVEKVSEACRRDSKGGYRSGRRRHHREDSR